MKFDKGRNMAVYELTGKSRGKYGDIYWYFIFCHTRNMWDEV